MENALLPLSKFTHTYSLKPSLPPAVLVLSDGKSFLGYGIGSPGSTLGEVVFNTSITGYQEILTDPSYTQQIVTLTYPHIGNVGVNSQDAESNKVYAAGLIIKDLASIDSSFRSQGSLHNYLLEQNVVGISGIDTRELTRYLRDHGAQGGAIVSGGIGDSIDDLLIRAKRDVSNFTGMSGLDLAQIVTTPTPYEWTQGEWQISDALGHSGFVTPIFNKTVVAYDFGVKRNILRMIAGRGCKVIVVPAKTTAKEVLAMQPDGIFLSNGPGDPEPCDYAISAAQTFLDKKIPLFGICLGHQIMGLAAGANTLKMKFGHHGANHPVKDLKTGRVVITSQNHGFAVDAKTLPQNVEATHVSLFDGSLQGLSWKDRPAFCFQGHPEASPGPQDVAYLFDRFVEFL